jgi:hypothetical protein
MKLPTIAEIRIPILIVLAVGEAIGFALLQGHRSFVAFIVLSTLGIPIVVSLLWIDWIRSRGVPYNYVLGTIMSVYWIPVSWVRGLRVLFFILVASFVISVVIILRRLLKRRNVLQGGRA